MLIQTKRAIENLKAAGLKRNEFSAQVHRHYVGVAWNGKPSYEYGKVTVTLWCSTARAIELTPALIQCGFNVTHYTDNGTIKLVLIEVTSNTGAGSFTIYDIDKKKKVEAA